MESPSSLKRTQLRANAGIECHFVAADSYELFLKDFTPMYTRKNARKISKGGTAHCICASCVGVGVRGGVRACSLFHSFIYDDDAGDDDFRYFGNRPCSSGMFPRPGAWESCPRCPEADLQRHLG